MSRLRVERETTRNPRPCVACRKPADPTTGVLLTIGDAVNRVRVCATCWGRLVVLRNDVVVQQLDAKELRV